MQAMVIQTLSQKQMKLVSYFKENNWQDLLSMKKFKYSSENFEKLTPVTVTLTAAQ